ncbi:MAG: hypothetical protein HY421_02195 [Candidatus Kerfeldbacteria bacterium]|nr:hypothetical protein [Candidatus Kerfeldbacteria bacterium]
MDTSPPQKPSGYGKRPLWQWIVIYLIIGAVVYGAIYYFAIAKKGGYGADSTNTNTSRSLY